MSFTGQAPSFPIQAPSFLTQARSFPPSFGDVSVSGVPHFTSSKSFGDVLSKSSFGDQPPLEIPSDLSRIPLEDIKQATNNFAEENIIEKKYDNWIVYKGELSGKKLQFISIFGKLISRDVPVLNELTKHQNIASLIGICGVDSFYYRILVVEHPTRGGLDKYVSSTAHLTWLMRLQICLDIASGVHYPQNHPKKYTLYTEYMNSASIHLDENWQAKIQLISSHELVYDPLELRHIHLQP